MSIYVDALKGCLIANNWRYTRFCHLTADTVEELIVFAVRIGCKEEWIQRSRRGIYHFDLTARMREKAIKAGAKERKHVPGRISMES